MYSGDISLDAGGASCYNNLNTKGKSISASLSLGRRLERRVSVKEAGKPSFPI